MKKLMPVFLAILLVFSCAFPAFAEASPEGRFDDVAADAWYATYVDYCAKNGVMIGIGEGLFAPDRTLTRMECLTLALRLYELVRGGDGVLGEAPGDWGRITLTLSDGTVYKGYGASQLPDRTDDMENESAQNGLWSVWTAPGMMGSVSQQQQLQCPVTEQEKERINALADRSATLELDGRVWTGTVHCWLPNSFWVLAFTPDGSEEETEAVFNVLGDAVRHSPDPCNWFRSSVYALYTSIPEEDRSGFASVADWQDLTAGANRRDFALALSAAAGELEEINEIAALPDTDDAAVLSLYRAGILTGMDEYGTLAGDRMLNRAEASAMVARVLDPSLRQEFHPLDCGNADALAQCAAFPWNMRFRLDTPYGILLSVYASGVPHGGEGLMLIRPDGSVVNLLADVPAANAWGVKPVPEDPELSEDGCRFRFTVHFAEWVSEEEHLIHEAGEYHYVCDLAAGTVEQI